jgi:hypothetical protein
MLVLRADDDPVGCLKSAMAAPSRRNSGLEATVVPSGAPCSARICAILSPVPTGTVDLVMTTAGPERPGKLANGGEDVGQVGMAVTAPGRRADGDEHRLGLIDALFEVGRERQPPAIDIRLDQGFEPRLPDRHDVPH